MSFYISGRRIVYTNQVPYETDILATNDYNMAGVSGLAQTVIGLGIGDTTTVSGLACTPVSPPGLGVVVGVGAMYSFEDYDATDYSVIPADTDPNHRLYKQAFNWNPVTLNLTAPATPGNSVIYLIEGIFDTTDVNDVSRPYFNSADPTMPIFNNNYDTRTDIILFQAKQGVPGVTPTPPAPDAGYTGLYYVTVANGQTVITGGDISKVSTVEGQPFITEGLTQKVSSSTIATGYVSIPAQQAATYVSGVDVGSANAIVCNPANNYAAPSLGMIISVLVANTNTGTATLKINGNSAINIQVVTSVGLASLSGGEMVAGGWYDFRYNGTTWQLLNPTEQDLIAGLIFDYGGGVVPSGFLLCDGSAVSRTTYANLFSSIGTTWGIGDGVSTFNVPDFSRRVAVGSGGAGSAVLGNSVGNMGGEETHTLTLSEIPSHNHTMGRVCGGNGSLQFSAGGGGMADISPNTGSAGSGGSHNNIQPSAIVTKIIKY